MRPQWNRLLPPCCTRGCCCDLAETQGLGLPWVDGYLQLIDPPSFFDFAPPTTVVGDGLQECDLLEV